MKSKSKSREKKRNKELKKTLKIIDLTLKLSRPGSKAEEMMQKANDKIGYWDESKIHRWIGYAQCLLVAEGATTIEKLADSIREADKPVITVMCDYCAWGLWLNGSAIDTDYLKEELDFDPVFVDKMGPIILRWQTMYEDFNFYQSEQETKKSLNSPDFKEFEKLGLEIFKEFLALDQDKYIIEYFDERTSKRIRTCS